MDNTERIKVKTEVLEVELIAEVEIIARGCSTGRISLYEDRNLKRWVIGRETFKVFADSLKAEQEFKVCDSASEVMKFLGPTLRAKELFLEIRDTRDREMFLRAFREATTNNYY